MAEVGGFRLRNGVVINVYDIVQHADRSAHGATEFVQIQLAILNVLGQIDRAEVANRDFFRVGIERNFGAQV